jgi:hypothetical protein
MVLRKLENTLQWSASSDLATKQASASSTLEKI